ncbi:MAG: DUF975 family protein, partial [Candidatus Cloacimonadaceae bacterium]|nr:DUF975 family protein [Candidatus Cloacimonadaceae bacterium]
MNNEQIRAEARALLENRWNQCVVLWLIVFGISMGIGWANETFGSIVSIIIGGPFALGVSAIFLKITYRQEFKFEDIFDGFKDFTRALTAYLLMCLYVFLWALCLIVPGIIAAISYAMVFFILAENPTMKAADALRHSKTIMEGHKTEYFMLQLSFIGWGILALLTFGIGMLWLASYVTTAQA